MEKLYMLHKDVSLKYGVNVYFSGYFSTKYRKWYPCVKFPKN